MSAFELDQHWTPAIGGEASRLKLSLTNHSPRAISGFVLAVCCPISLELTAAAENCTVFEQVGSYARLAPPPGLVLAPGQSWSLVLRGIRYPLMHYSDAISNAWLLLPDLETDIRIAACVRAGEGPRPVREPEAPESVSYAGLSLLPFPREQASTGRLDGARGLFLDTTDPVARVFSELCRTLFGAQSPVREEPGAGVIEVEIATEPGLEPEAYRLAFDGQSVRVVATTRVGHLYGLISLGQMMLGAMARGDAFGFPSGGHIADVPEYAWRGFHLDAARQFYSLAETERMLAIMCWNKLNRFHWHLSDDEAWRIEIKGLPTLTEIGAFRGEGLAMPPLCGSGAERYGGYYSQEEVRGLVALAESYGIQIIPEIDMPAHCYAALQALPELVDPAQDGTYVSGQGFPNNCLDPLLPGTMSFVETVIGELAELFPGPWLHVGGDEVAADAWSNTPAGRQAMAELGGDGGPHRLQSKFLQQVQAVVRRHGKTTGAWEEAAYGGGIDKHNAYLVAWRDAGNGVRLGAEGYDVVLAPGQAYYLDMATTADWWQPGAHWAGHSTAGQTYRFDPLANWPTGQRDRLMGVQACFWGETAADREIAGRLIFPRLSAVAETAWSAPEAKSWARFAAVAPLMPVLNPS